MRPDELGGLENDGSPAVSVIVPTFNRARYLPESLDSILNQTYRDYEVIVIDDGSTDETGMEMRRYPQVRYFSQPHAGIGPARNHGVRRARGHLLAFLDSDDLWPSDKLAIQMRSMEKLPEVDVFYGHVRQFRDGASPDDDLRTADSDLPGWCPGTMLVRAEAFRRVGWFATEWEIGADFDWHLRATEANLKPVMLPQILLLRRLHDTNQGVVRRAARTDYARILKAALDRRRASGLLGPLDSTVSADVVPLGREAGHDFSGGA